MALKDYAIEYPIIGPNGKTDRSYTIQPEQSGRERRYVPKYHGEFLGSKANAAEAIECIKEHIIANKQPVLTWKAR